MPRKKSAKEAKPEKEKAPVLSEVFFDHDKGEWTQERKTRYGLVAGFSMKGSQHEGDFKPNQDAASVYESEKMTILSVLDGLGGAS